MSTFEVMEGSPGLRTDEIAHVLSPGRGRNETGDGLSPKSLERVMYAADFFIAQELEAGGGVMLASGYKTPADKAGRPWSPEEGFNPTDDNKEVFCGIPEAYSAGEVWLKRGISRAAIRVEPRSIDTATNFARSEREGHFPDERPVAIAAQEAHLERMIRRIAPKTLRREFLGIVVPEGDQPDDDSFFAELESRAVLLGVNPNTPHIVGRTTFLANTIRGVWAIPAPKKSAPLTNL
jgi:hypothetical protein